MEMVVIELCCYLSILCKTSGGKMRKNKLRINTLLLSGRPGRIFCYGITTEKWVRLRQSLFAPRFIKHESV